MRASRETSATKPALLDIFSESVFCVITGESIWERPGSDGSNDSDSRAHGQARASGDIAGMFACCASPTRVTDVDTRDADSCPCKTYKGLVVTKDTTTRLSTQCVTGEQWDS